MDTSSKSSYMPALRFEGITPYYDAVVGLTSRERRFKQVLIDLADIRSGQQVLDLSSGTGALAICLKKTAPMAHVTCIDADAKVIATMQAKAAKAGTDIHFDIGEADQLPYADEQFERVLSSLFFHHLSWEFKHRAAAELYRVMKPGAELYIADWGCPRSRLMRGLLLPIQLFDGFASTQDNIDGKLIPLFKDNGFEQVTVQQTLSTMFGTMTLYRAVKPLNAPPLLHC